jgi:hypothetical protein
MAGTVYLETTIPSYLAARASRDLVTAAHQQLTVEWWQTRRTAFDLYVSELVLQEAGLGDAEVARRRLEHLVGIPSLAITAPAQGLAEAFLRASLVPTKAAADALHIAVAAVHGVDYLLGTSGTWPMPPCDAGSRRPVAPRGSSLRSCARRKN